MRFSPFRLDVENECLWRGEQAVRLTPKAFAVLQHLVRHAGRLVSKKELLAEVWPEIAVGEAVLKVSIGEIRKALGDQAQAPQFIETVHRRGYRFIAPLTIASQSVQDPTFNAQNAEEFSGQRLTSRGKIPQSAIYPPRSMPTLMGREAELAQLQSWLERALRGGRQVVFVIGEAGIGKTTLIEEFLTQAAARHDLCLARGQCFDHYGTGEAYLAGLAALSQAGRDPGGEALIRALRRFAATWL